MAATDKVRKSEAPTKSDQTDGNNINRSRFLSTMKLSMIGTGAVGSTAAFVIAQQSLVDEIILVDIVDSVRGKALDMQQSMAIFESNTKICGTTDIEDIKDSNIIVVTAGIPRQPGKTREDLLQTNAEILRSIFAKVKELAPNTILIMVTNPLDVMTMLAIKETGFEKSKIIGMAGTLDTARFKSFIKEKTSGEINAMVIGSHNNEMIPLTRLATVDGKPIIELLSGDEIEAIVKNTQQGGAQVTTLLQNCSAYMATGGAIMQLVKAIVKDTKEVLPASVLLEGEYDLRDVCIGVPIRLGKQGIEEIILLDLADNEKEQLKSAAKKLQELGSLIF